MTRIHHTLKPKGGPVFKLLHMVHLMGTLGEKCFYCADHLTLVCTNTFGPIDAKWLKIKKNLFEFKSVRHKRRHTYILKEINERKYGQTVFFQFALLVFNLFFFNSYYVLGQTRVRKDVETRQIVNKRSPQFTFKW